jgi:predicted anti-sigma-YlaC factor YlaD
MTCDDVRDLLPDLLSGAGDPRLDEHLQACAACRDEADLVRALVARVRGALEPTTSVTPPALEGVLAAARAAGRSRRALGILARAAALLVAAGLGALVDRALIRPAVDEPDVAPAPAVEASPADDPGLREALAERPGGLAASLALLDAMSRPAPITRR